MPEIFTHLMKRLGANLVWFYRYAIDYYEECDLEDMNIIEIEATSHSMQAYEMY